MKRMKKYWPRVAAVLALVLVLIAPLPVGVAQGNKDKDNKGNGSNGNPRVHPPNSRPYGMTYAGWGVEFWRWLVSVPASVSLLENCGIGQSGPVWFLSVPTQGAATGSCTVPAGKSIFFPILAVQNDYPCPPEFNFEPAPGQSLEDFLTEGAMFFIDQITELEVIVDGEPLENLFNYRATSDLYFFTGDPSLVIFDPCITGTRQPAVSDGYWVMLKHLSRGTHTIRIRGEAGYGSVDVTYNLTVVK